MKYLGIWKSQDINSAHFLSSAKVADLKLDVTPYPHCTRYLKILALISQGVDNGIFDDAIFRQYMYSTAIEFHSFLTPLILEFRATAAKRVAEKEHVNSGTAYEEVNRLIERWKNAGYEMKPEHQPWQLKNAPLF